MNKILDKSINATKIVTALLFIAASDNFIVNHKLIACIPNEYWILLCKSTLIIASLLLFGLIYYYCSRQSVIIKKDNMKIIVEYGDLFRKDGCKKVIDFDECFTTVVGERPEEVKRGSVCGQYLIRYPIDDNEMDRLLKEAKVEPEKEKSLFNNKSKYKQGKLIPRGESEYLLMSFASLNEVGRGEICYDEYISCLNLLWKEIDVYYGQKDVCIPILGSGKVRFKDIELTQQELLDIIISSYKLSRYKLKLPNCLHIVCKKREGFSLRKIDEF